MRLCFSTPTGLLQFIEQIPGWLLSHNLCQVQVHNLGRECEYLSVGTELWRAVIRPCSVVIIALCWFHSLLLVVRQRMRAPPYKAGKARNLHYAAHRFESTQVPLAEMVAWILPAIALAHEVVGSKRKSDAGNASQAFIDGLDASTSARLVLL